MKFKTSYLYLVAAISIVLCEVFYYFPIMGHDYSMFLPALVDYHYAWEKFGILHFDFSPQRCLGIPVWASPTATLFSVFHFLSLFLNDLNVLVAYIVLILALSYWGVLKLQDLFNCNKTLRNYFAFAWCLQGYLVSRVIVGHVPFIAVGLWPLYCYILLKPSTSKRKFWNSTLLFTFFYTAEFYSGNTYLFVMFPIAFALFCMFLKFNGLYLAYKNTFKKFIIGILLTVPLILPKVLAVISYTSNFIRENSFIDIGLMKGFEYSIMSLLFPVPLNFRQMTGWVYGNWESINFLFPGLMLFILSTSVLRFKTEKRIFISLIGLIVAGAFIASGVYSEFVLLLPIVKSFHVNPRWMPIISLSILGVSLIYSSRNIIPTWTKCLLTILAVLPTIYILDRADFQIDYYYHSGFDKENNRMAYCYEPTFGYRLELMPRPDVPAGRYLDPRCYIGKTQCTDYLLPKELHHDIESYKLRPFKN